MLSLRNLSVLRLLFIAAVLVSGISFKTHAADKLSVVTTTTMLTDLVKQVGGDRVDVQGLMGPGVDPHLYKPTASDVSRLQNAKIIFYNGLMLEGQMTELFQQLGKNGRQVHAVSEGIPAGKILHSEGEAHADPHIWGDAQIWAMCIPGVAKVLADADPDGKAIYDQRAKDYAAELSRLHEWALKRAASIPEASRILITSHDAFNYLGRAYGFQVVGVQGLSTVSEAGLADIVKIVDFIKQKNVRAVFVESSVPKAAIERISKDSGAKVGGELFSDALGTPGNMKTVNGETYDEGTYVGMLKHNLDIIVENLK